MLAKITEFFRNLPSKKCSVCGHDIDEQDECYGNTCSKCLNVKDI
nr:protein YhfH [Bacillus licheniformis]